MRSDVPSYLSAVTESPDFDITNSAPLSVNDIDSNPAVTFQRLVFSAVVLEVNVLLYVVPRAASSGQVALSGLQTVDVCAATLAARNATDRRVV